MTSEDTQFFTLIKRTEKIKKTHRLLRKLDFRAPVVQILDIGLVKLLIENQSALANCRDTLYHGL